MVRKKILVVDDDEAVRTIFVAILGRPYDVFSVRSGEAALKLLYQGHQYDLLLSDVDMPGGVSGIELMRIAKAKGLIPTAKLALMSGWETSEIRHACAELGVEFLPKPINPIMPTIARLLER